MLCRRLPGFRVSVFQLFLKLEVFDHEDKQGAPGSVTRAAKDTPKSEGPVRMVCHDDPMEV